MSLLVDWVSTKAHTSYMSYLVHQYTSTPVHQLKKKYTTAGGGGCD